MNSPLNIRVTAHSCESKEALTKSGEKAGVSSILLGLFDENPREFTALDISSGAIPVGIVGIASYGVGIRPQHIVHGTKMIVGYNKCIVIVETKPLIILTQIDLLSLFWEFISPRVAPEIIALCETAIVAFTDFGRILWRHDTDLIKTHNVFGSHLILTFDDSPACRIDLVSGNKLRG